MEQEGLQTIVVSELEAGERLDKILSKRFQEVKSRTYFQYLIEEKAVLLNGSAIKKRFKPQRGDEIEIHFICTPELGLEPQPIPLDLVYEDEEILVINKPAGMVVHPAPGNWSGTFVNALLYHCEKLRLASDASANASETLRPGIVHRLDKDTTGLLLAAKTRTAQQRLIEMFSARKIYKEYLAICVGNPGDAVLDFPIARHPVYRQKMAVLKEGGGRSARSLCKTLYFDGKISVVNVVLETGRTHQIRVHMKHHGFPVLGDRLYGNEQANEKFGVKRQLLHASLLRLQHPMSARWLELKAPLPSDIKSYVPVSLLNI